MSESIDLPPEDYSKLSNKDLTDLKALFLQTITYYNSVLLADLPPGNRIAFELCLKQNKADLDAVETELNRRLPRPSAAASKK